MQVVVVIIGGPAIDHSRRVRRLGNNVHRSVAFVGNDINGNDFSPNYDIRNAGDAEIIADNLFSNAPADGGAKASPENCKADD